MKLDDLISQDRNKTMGGNDESVSIDQLLDNESGQMGWAMMRLVNLDTKMSRHGWIDGTYVIYDEKQTKSHVTLVIPNKPSIHFEPTEVDASASDWYDVEAAKRKEEEEKAKEEAEKNKKA